MMIMEAKDWLGNGERVVIWLSFGLGCILSVEVSLHLLRVYEKQRRTNLLSPGNSLPTIRGKLSSSFSTRNQLGNNSQPLYGLPTSSGGDGQDIVEQASGEGYASLLWHPLAPQEKRRYTLEQKRKHLFTKGVSVMPISYYAARANL